jgi:hypothetical protein
MLRPQKQQANSHRHVSDCKKMFKKPLLQTLLLLPQKAGIGEMSSLSNLLTELLKGLAVCDS